jgi:hypothetical protein
MFRQVIVCAVLLASGNARKAAALGLVVGYPVLERAVADQLFADQGRYYLAGGSSDECSYAFLESPHLGGEAGSLVLRAHFSGRAGTDVLGQCVGPGDSFDVVLRGHPRFEGGVVFLADAEVEVPDRPFYTELVRQALQGSVASSLRYDLGEELRKVAKGAEGRGVQVAVSKLTVTKLVAEADRLEITADLHVVVSR